MILRALFIIVSSCMFVMAMYLQWKLFVTVLKIRKSNPQLLRGAWNDWAVTRRLKQAARENSNITEKKIMTQYFVYRRMQIYLVVGGLLVLLLIGFINSRFQLA